MRYIIFVLIFLSIQVWGQTTVYYKTTVQADYSTNLINTGFNNIICYSKYAPNGFGMVFIDSSGDIYNHVSYGTPGVDVLSFGRKSNNGKIILTGWTFYYDTTGMGNYKGYAVITDTLGNFEHSFPIMKSNTIFNKVYNGIEHNGAYYFCGNEYDSTCAFATSEIFMCKTDLSGNVIWYRTFPQYNSSVIFNMGLESTFNGSSILMGSMNMDSAIGFDLYFSYLFLEIDTLNGNLLQRIQLPTQNNLFLSHNNLMQISQISNQRYLASGDRDLFVLDSALNIIENNSLIYPYVSGKSSYKLLHDESFVAGGYKAFARIHNNQALFIKDFSNEPDITELRDVVPLYDGGYLALIEKSTNVTYIKLDCEGNYINPTYCSPLNSQAIEKPSNMLIYPNPAGEFLHIKSDNAFMNASVRIINVVGELCLQKHTLNGNLIHLDITDLVEGVYVAEIWQGNQTHRIKFIKE